MASEREFEVEIVGTAYLCQQRVMFVLTVDSNREPIEHDEPGENSEDHETIFQHWLERAIETTWRTEIEAGRVGNVMPNNPVGFVEDF